MKLLKNLYDELLYPYRLNKFYNFDTYRIYTELLLSQYKSLADIMIDQELNLNTILQSALNNNKYYSDIFTIKKDIKLDQLKDLPCLTKADILNNFNNIYSKYSAKEFEHITSGSTGQPLKIISSNLSEAHRAAQRLRFYSWWDIKPSDANVLVWGKMETDTKPNNSLLKRFGLPFKEQSFIINVFELNTSSIKYYYNQILKIKPKYIRGYTSAIFQFANLLEQCKLNGVKLGLKVAITTSEILLSHQKNYIEKILNVRVADEYGAAEIGLFAYDCPEGGKHICEELLYIFTNEENEVITTDLHNYSMPLINYKIGDKIYISDKPCKCGRSSRIIERIEGRTGDNILTENGEYLSQYLFYYAVKELDKLGLSNSILQYKVMQDNMVFEFIIVKGNNFTDKVENYLHKRMIDKIGKNITVNFRYVDEIPKEKSGKIRFFQRIN